jgi:hypothetical protein
MAIGIAFLLGVPDRTSEGEGTPGAPPPPEHLMPAAESTVGRF